MKRNVCFFCAVFLCCGSLFAASIGAAGEDGDSPAQTAKSVKTSGGKGLFFDWGMTFNHITFDPLPEVSNNGLNLLAGLGYDFGRWITLGASFDMGLYALTEYSGPGYENTTRAIDSSFGSWWDIGIAFDLGIKLVHSKTFSLIIPAGLSMRWYDIGVTFTPNYGYKFADGSSKKTLAYKYTFTSVETGVIFAFRTGKGEILVPFKIGFPVSKSVTYPSELSGLSANVDVINWSVGFVWRGLF